MLATDTEGGRIQRLSLTIECPYCHAARGERCTSRNGHYYARGSEHLGRWGLAKQLPNGGALAAKED